LKSIKILLRVNTNNFEEENYWEIVKDDYPLHRIIKDIESAGFKIVKTYRIFENPYHRFYIKERETNL